MHASPSLLGAVAAVLVTGVACGAELGKVPDTSRVAMVDTAPPARGPAIDWNSNVARATPDHYPIVTPEGRFEVDQLSDRGLYHNARYAPAMAFSSAVEAPPAPQPAREPSSAPAPDRQLVVYDATQAPDAQPPAQPELADASDARVIDVAAELAAR